MVKDSDFVIKSGLLTQYTGKDEHIIIPNTVTAIGDMAFADNQGIRSVIMPSSVLEIGHGIFGGCKNLAKVVFSDSITEIASLTFVECSSLMDVVLPQKLTTIKRLAFFRCTSLAAILLPESVACISSNAFEGCSSLTEIECPRSIKKIGDRAFAFCTDLRYVSILGDDLELGCSIFEKASPHIRIEYAGTSAAFAKMVLNQKRQKTLWTTIGNVTLCKPIAKNEQQFIYNSDNTFCIDVFCKKDGKCLTFRNNKA